MRIFKLKQQLALSLLTISLISGCGSTPTQTVDVPQPTTISGWLERADADATHRPTHLLEAANLAILQADYTQAGNILSQVQPTSAAEKQHLALYRAEVAIAANDNNTANMQLQMVDATALSVNVFDRWLAAQEHTLAEAERYGEAATLLATHFERVGPEQQPQTAKRLWHYLDQDTTEIHALSVVPWQQLHAIVVQAHSAVALQRNLKRWQAIHPAHPATQALSQQMASLITAEYTPPSQIAVLLPLTGKYRKAGEAIRSGILQSWFMLAERAPAVHFYDTNSGSVTALYQQAKAAGADAIIGPLLKESVASLLMVIDPSIPTLILNRSETTHENKQLVFFALPPEAEGEQTARWLQQQGIEHPLLLATGGHTNKRTIDGFASYHAEQDQVLSDDATEPYVQHHLTRTSLFQKQIEQAMGIKDSKARIAQLKTLTGADIKSQPRSRRDLDGVYIAATPADTRLIKSFLDVTVSPYAERLPVYIGSRAHAGYRNELEGTIIGDLAINISPEMAAEKEQVLSLHPSWKASDLRLFALGFDSLKLIEQIGLIRSLPEFSLQGLSGILRISDKGNIEVDMPWAKYRNGSLQPIAKQH